MHSLSTYSHILGVIMGFT